MSERPLVIYHANCPDGFCAAWVARKALGPDCEFVPAQYGQDPPSVRGREVYILDFSYKRSVVRGLMRIADKLVILDHHATAAVELDGVIKEESGFFAYTSFEPPTIVFDMEKSGGRLAWEYFFPGEPAPWLVEYTEDRDLWRWRLDHSRAINDALGSHERSFAVWDDFHYLNPDAILGVLRADGYAIGRYKHQLIDSICRNAREIEIAGYKVLAANTSVLFSEVAGKLAEGRPFGAAWLVRADGKRQWSLRSTNEGVDVSEVARSFGGGGHRNAAGFEDMPINMENI